jgi:hypothetical protein
MKKSAGILIISVIALSLTTILVPARASDLIVGRNTDVVGNVLVSKAGDYLRIKFEITDSKWCMTKTHLHVAPSLENIPQTKNGNPIPGRFDYKGLFDYSTGANMCGMDYTYLVELNGLTGLLYIAAHADVINQVDQKEEGAWADGEEFSGSNWATYFTYTVPPPGPIPR